MTDYVYSEEIITVLLKHIIILYNFILNWSVYLREPNIIRHVFWKKWLHKIKQQFKWNKIVAFETDCLCKHFISSIFFHNCIIWLMFSYPLFYISTVYLIRCNSIISLCWEDGMAFQNLWHNSYQWKWLEYITKYL